VYGLIVPGGNTQWQASGVIVLEKETGNRYVYLNGKLDPVANQASAMLVLGASAKVVRVSRASLKTVPTGPTIGISGAPSVIPPASDLARGPWVVCPVGAAALALNVPAAAHAMVVPGDRYLWVADPDGAQFIIWRNRKLPVGDDTVPPALGLAAGQPPVVPRVWLGWLSTGPRIAAPAISGAGAPGADVAGARRRVGDLMVQNNPNGTRQYYVLLADGVAPIGGTEYALLSAKERQTATPVDAPALVAAAHSRAQLEPVPDILTARPVASDGAALCIRQRPQAKNLVNEFVSVPVHELPAGGLVVLPAGAAMLVAATPMGNGQRTPDRYLVTEQGEKFLLAGDDVVGALGYGGVEPVPMLQDVLATIPSGPALSRAAVGVTEG
jgi:type VII secretion protein EccB